MYNIESLKLRFWCFWTPAHTPSHTGGVLLINVLFGGDMKMRFFTFFRVFGISRLCRKPSKLYKNTSVCYRFYDLRKHTYWRKCQKDEKSTFSGFRVFFLPGPFFRFFAFFNVFNEVLQNPKTTIAMSTAFMQTSMIT